MGKELFTAKQFIKAIPNTGGIITKIAERVGCAWHTAKKYIEQYPTIQQAYQNECERVLDIAESALIKSVTEQEAWAVKYILSTKGKKRGYVERQELEHGGDKDAPLRIEVVYANSPIGASGVPPRTSED